MAAKKKYDENSIERYAGLAERRAAYRNKYQWTAAYWSLMAESLGYAYVR